jgi:hypothetical protein
MSRFTPEQIAAIRAKSEQLLRDKPPDPPPAPEPVREVPIVFEDAMDRWRKEADERDREREAARDQMRREQRDAERARSADWNAWVDARIAAALAEHDAQLTGFEQASAEFSNKVLQGFDRLDGLVAQLDTKLTELRALNDLQRADVLDLPDFRRRAN